jgi:hypothetical protein
MQKHAGITTTVCLSLLIGTPGWCQVSTEGGGPRSQYQHQPAVKSPQQPLWVQYMKAGELSRKAGNGTLAKQYYLGALTSLEKTASHRKDTVVSKVDGKTYHIPIGTMRVQMLEQELTGLYPDDWSKAPGTATQQLALKEEQVSVLGRIARLNSSHDGSHSHFAGRYEQRYEKAMEELKQAKEQLAAGDVKQSAQQTPTQ